MAVFLAHRDLGDELLPFLESFGDVADVGAGDGGAAVHLGEAVAQDLAFGERTAEGLALAQVAGGQVDAALGDGDGLHGHPDPFGGELAHDLEETLVAFAEEVAGRDTDTVQGQLGGVGGEPAHLVELARGREAGGIGVDHEQGDALVAGIGGAGGDGDEVGAVAGGDEHLGSVDDPLVAVGYGPRAQLGDVGSAVGFGDGQGADAFAREGGADVVADQVLALVGDEGGQGDAVGEQ